MWVDELSIENIKCFSNFTVRFSEGEKPYKWVTLLGENGVGKSTLLQALGLLLAGPEAANQLLTKPVGWVSDPTKAGKISARIHRSANDPGEYGSLKKRTAFGYTYFITGPERLTIRNKEYSEPAIIENPDRGLTWLRQNAFLPKGSGWFAMGFGAFRRLTRENQIIVPTLQQPVRATGFSTQFNEDKPLAVLEQWLVYLDYRLAKSSDKLAKTQFEYAKSALNRVLPNGVSFHSVNQDGRILFSINGQQVPTLSLSDGYRSVLAFAGELIWRLVCAFPDSPDPLSESGVVLIDEIDIHLHPTWQRSLPKTLRTLFPNIQFIVTTHSPFIAAGAGDDAITYRIAAANETDTKVEAKEVKNVAFMTVEAVLKSDAFELVSTYSPETQQKIDRYLVLRGQRNRSLHEQAELDLITPVAQQALVAQPEAEKTDLEKRLESFLAEKLPDDHGK